MKDYLIHYRTKGSKGKDTKYIDIVDGVYIYSKDQLNKARQGVSNATNQVKQAGSKVVSKSQAAVKKAQPYVNQAKQATAKVVTTAKDKASAGKAALEKWGISAVSKTKDTYKTVKGQAVDASKQAKKTYGAAAEVVKKKTNEAANKVYDKAKEGGRRTVETTNGTTKTVSYLGEQNKLSKAVTDAARKVAEKTGGTTAQKQLAEKNAQAEAAIKKYKRDKEVEDTKRRVDEAYNNRQEQKRKEAEGAELREKARNVPEGTTKARLERNAVNTSQKINTTSDNARAVIDRAKSVTITGKKAAEEAEKIQKEATDLGKRYVKGLVKDAENATDKSLRFLAGAKQKANQAAKDSEQAKVDAKNSVKEAIKSIPDNLISRLDKYIDNSEAEDSEAKYSHAAQQEINKIDNQVKQLEKDIEYYSKGNKRVDPDTGAMKVVSKEEISQMEQQIEQLKKEKQAFNKLIIR